jgi:hypothetical protein
MKLVFEVVPNEAEQTTTSASTFHDRAKTKHSRVLIRSLAHF